MENLLSSDECTEIIKNFLKCDNFVVQRFQLFPIKDSYPGFCAEYFKLKIMFHDIQGFQVIRSFFVKSLPIGEIKKKMIEDYGIFKKEVLLYKELIPKLKKYSGNYKWCPECYYLRDDILVFEDLTLSSYKTIPLQIEFNSEHLQKALKTLSVFHTSSIVFESRELIPKGTNIGQEFKNMLFETTFFHGSDWTECGIQAIKTAALERTKYGKGTKYEPLIEAEFKAKVRKTYDMVKDPVYKVSSVFCHRDLWSNNLMFKFDKDDDSYSRPQHCLLLDFAISRYLPLTVDVLTIIILGTRRQHRKQHFERYLNYYYQCLKDELVNHQIQIDKLFTWTEFRKNCNDFLLVSLVMNTIFITVTRLPQDRLIHLSENDQEGYKKIMIENRDDLIMETMDKDQYFREILTESLEELIEFLFDIKG